MTKMFLALIFLLALVAAPNAETLAPGQEVKLTYKAYWGGFVVSEISSTVYVGPSDYHMEVSYEVTGLAAIFNKMKNKVSARGMISPDGTLRPLVYENEGSWGAEHGYKNRTEFNPDDSKIISHDYDFKFKKEYSYIPIKDALKFGPDMVSFYLGLTLDKTAIKLGPDFKHQNVFGGFFLLDIAYRCLDHKQQTSRRSLYQGDVLACEFNDKIIAGDFKKTTGKKKKKKRKRKKKNRSDLEPVPVHIWYAHMAGVDAMVPVYSEFDVTWGKVRVYLTDMDVIAQRSAP